MKSILLMIIGVGLLAYAGNVSAGGVPQHSAEVKEIISIHAKMTELDKLLMNKPEDPSLNHAMEKLETELISKMKQYNAVRRTINVEKKRAQEAIPATGAPKKN